MMKMEVGVVGVVVMDKNMFVVVVHWDMEIVV